MASAILRSAGALRHRLPRLVFPTARSTPRALVEEGRRFLAPRAGLPATGNGRLFSSSAAVRSYKHPCKFNQGRKRLGMVDQLESIHEAVKRDARGWREMREQLEQNQIQRAALYKRQDRVVGCASAAVAVALLAANVMRSD